MKLSFSLALTLVLLLAGQVFSQRRIEDIVYLNNGSIIRGTIVGTSDQNVTIESARNTWVFEHKEVSKMETGKKKSSSVEINEKGFYNISDIGLLIGYNGGQNVATPSFQMVNGLKLNKHLSTGIGIGYERLDIPMLPLFVDTRWDILPGKFSPFVAMQSGYSLSLRPKIDDEWSFSKHYGGILINPSVGFRNYFSNGNAMIVSLGFRHQRNTEKGTYRDWWSQTGTAYERDYLYNRFSLRMGFLFN